MRQRSWRSVHACVCVYATGLALHYVAAAPFDELAVLTLIRASLLARLQQT